jgi:hypothetical protein
MDEDGLNYGPLIATVGAALLAVSVFLPWYGLSLTAAGVAFSQQQLNSVAAQFGNSAFQSAVNDLHAKFGALAGQQLGTVSGHDALQYLPWVLLIIAAVAFVSGLLRLAGAQPSLPRNAQVAVIGMLATLCVLFRMVDPPTPQNGLVSTSLSAGIWLALGSSLAIVVGGLWTPGRRPADRAAPASDVPEGISGWTPEA